MFVLFVLFVTVEAEFWLGWKLGAVAILGVLEPEADTPGVKPATAGFSLGNALLAFSFLSLLMVSLFLICSRSMGDLPGTKAGAAVGAAELDESIAALSTTLGVKLGELMLNFGIAIETW